MSLLPWQRTNILSAANYLRELNSSGTGSAKTEALQQGLLEVLDPARRVARLQREMASSTKAAATGGKERRAGRDRRSAERRKADQDRPAGERRRNERRGGERRASKR
jgi:hypothetical protein